MNEANQFHQEMAKKQMALQNGQQDHTDAASQLSGNEDALGNPPPTRAMDGKPAGKQTLNPNG
jgi:hypothetical protein